MKTQQTERTRLSPRRAEALIPAVDALLVGSLVLVGRPIAAEMPAAQPDEGVALAWIAFGALATTVLLIWSHQAGHYHRRRPFGLEVADLLGWIFVLGALDLGLCLLGGIDPLPAGVVWTAVAVALPIQRKWLRQRLDELGLWQRPTVIVGVGYNAEIAARALLGEPSLGLSVIAFADPGEARSSAHGVVPRMIEVEGALRPVLPLSRLLPERGGDPTMRVVIAPDAEETPACIDLFERLAGAERDVDFLPPLGRAAVADPRLRERLSTPIARVYKRGFDLVLGLAIGLCAVPLLLAVALAVLMIDGRPIFFAQTRVGMNGRPFACFKFRTMVTDADGRLRALLESDPRARAEWQRDRKLRNDPRISRTGAWLRRTSLDELPQLLNVIRGDMSLIGPRPVVEEELRRYGPAAALYLKIRPGLSGLWQVSGRNEIDYGRRVELDCRYVRNWSPTWDIALLVATIRVVLTGRGAY